MLWTVLGFRSKAREWGILLKNSDSMDLLELEAKRAYAAKAQSMWKGLADDAYHTFAKVRNSQEWELACKNA